MKKLIFLFLCLKTCMCEAQNEINHDRITPHLDELIEKYTDSLLTNGFDTTISFSCQQCFGTLLYDSIGNSIDDAFLIAAFSTQKLEIVKFVHGEIDSLKIFGFGKSQKIEIKDKDTLQLIRRLTKSSEGENLAPYVYQIKQNGHEVYYPLFYSHPGYDLINIKSINHKRNLSIEVNSVKEKWFDSPNSPVNLNYDYNKSLHLYSLHSLLISLSTRVFNLKPINCPKHNSEKIMINPN